MALENASSADFDAIAALNVAAFAQFAPHLDPGEWKEMQSKLRNIAERAQKAQFLVCRASGEIAGAVGYCPAGKSDPAMFEHDMASVLLLAVHPSHRGQGLARALTAECIARARRDGAPRIALFTSELMQPAQRIYRSLGFRLNAELAPRYGIRYFLYVMPLGAQG